MGNNNYGHIKPEYLKPELSTNLYKTTYNYLSRFHTESIFQEVCNELQMPIGYLLEPDNWVSMSFGAQFARKITERTGDPEVYRKIGHFYFSPENMNPFEYSLLKTLSPHLVLRTAEQFYRKRNAVCSFKLTKLGFGKYNFEIKSDTPVYYEMALNTLGALEAYQKLYSLDLFNVDLKIDNPKKIREFQLTMTFAAFNFYFRRTFVVGILLTIGLAVGYLLSHAETFFGFNFLPVLTGIAYALGFLAYKLSESLKIFKASNDEYHVKIRDKNINVYEKSQLLERRYQEAKLLKDLSSELIGCRDPHKVIEHCLVAIQEKFDYKKAAVFLISEERQRLYLANSIGFENLPIDPSKIEFVYPNPDTKDGFVATVVDRGETKLILDLENYKQILKPQNRFLLDALKVGSMIISPIQSGSRKFGAFVLIREGHELLLDNQDKFLVENITSQLSLYFESAMNFENEVKLRSIFQKYVPRTVLDQLAEERSGATGSLAPKRQKICSVFMDLRGFTKACDGATPEHAFSLINQFAEFATSRLAMAGAIIDNIIGDEIVSFFTSKTETDTEVAERTLSAVRKIQSDFPKFSEKLADAGFPNIRLGIGVHFGEASVGSVGGEAKMNYTALGSTVNVASRLQSLSKKFEIDLVTVIVSEDFLKLTLREIDFSPFLQKEILRGTSMETKFMILGAVETSFEPSKEDRNGAA